MISNFLDLHDFAENASDLSVYLESFRILFDKHRDGVLITNADSTIIYYNEQQSALDEMPVSKVLGKKICEVYNISVEESPTMQVLLTGRSISDSVHFYRTRYGNLVNSSCHIYPLMEKNILYGAISFIQSYSMLSEYIFEHQVCEISDIPSTPLMKKKHRKPTETTNAPYRFSHLIGKSTALKEAVAIAKKASISRSSIMLIGETGTGKEMFAQSIHNHSMRREQPYTAINCSAVPETLLEGILFGTTNGAFTGAIDKAGLFEMTHGGTLFLDEVDSMPLSLQSKLLRVLQEKTVRRVGGLTELEVDIKIISSIACSPTKCLELKLLRPDFYYRLGVVRIVIPSLRERMEDVHLLTNFFINKYSNMLRRFAPLITPEAIHLLYNYAWPGNVRELEHVIEACLNILEKEQALTVGYLLRIHPDMAKNLISLKTTNDAHYSQKQEKIMENELNFFKNFEENNITVKKNVHAKVDTALTMDVPSEGLQNQKEGLELLVITRALTTAGGKVNLAAQFMHISPQLLHYKLRKYGIDRNNFIPKLL